MNVTPKSERILIVDDEKLNIDILRNILQDYVKVAALNGEHALRVAWGNAPPDLILLDVMMPGLDGYEVCRRLKEDERTRDIPVIFVTAKAEMDDEITGFAAGAVDYIVKPVSPPVVLARVKTHLALCAAYQSLKHQHASLAEKEAYIRSLIDHALDMIVSLDADLNIVEFNHAAEKGFGHTAAEVQGQPFRDLFAQEIKCDLLEGLLVSKGRYAGEMAMRGKTGKTFPAFLKFNALKETEGKMVGVIGSLRDMTQEKLLAKLMLNKQNKPPA